MVKLKPTAETAARAEARKAIWKHNSFMGHAIMMNRQAAVMMEAETTTYEAKALAIKIQELSAQLLRALKTRTDLPHPVS